MGRMSLVGVLVVSAFAGGALTGRLASGKSPEEGPLSMPHRFGEILALVENEYVDPTERDRLYEGALKGMVGELDPHSVYFPADEFRVFQGDTQGKFGGVGLEVEAKDGQIIVLSPMEGSPAERAGILSGDRIVAIDNEPTRGQPLEKLIRKMRGPVGAKVVLMVVSPPKETARPVTLTREEIHVKSVASKRLTNDIGYVRLRQFQSETHAQMLAAFGAMRAESKTPLTAVILDLRANPGGFVEVATNVADEFLDGGVIFTARHRGKVVEEVRATAGGAAAKIPVVVLVNEYSASASELVAGALQDQGRATVVGQTTFGKGSVQSILVLPTGDGMKLTTQRYFTPSGRGIQAVGVVPDVVVAGAALPASEVVRERDLDNHLGPEGKTQKPAPPAIVPPEGSASPPKAEPERAIPVDPLVGKDEALKVAFRIAIEKAAQAAGKIGAK
jgi:carboxyl-terminal processing protease